MPNGFGATGGNMNKNLVLQDGNLLQTGTPRKISNQPVDDFVAALMRVGD